MLFLSVFHVLADLCTLSASILCVVFVPLPLFSERHGFSLPGVLFCCLLPASLLLEYGFDAGQQLMEMYFRG